MNLHRQAPVRLRAGNGVAVVVLLIARQWPSPRRANRQTKMRRQCVSWLGIVSGALCLSSSNDETAGRAFLAQLEAALKNHLRHGDEEKNRAHHRIEAEEGDVD